MNKYFYKAVVATMAVLLLASCSWSKKDKEPKQAPLTDYRESRTRTPLEIPPDLSAESSDKSLSVPVYKPRQPAAPQPTVVATPTKPVEQEKTAANVSAGKPVIWQSASTRTSASRRRNAYEANSASAFGSFDCGMAES